MEKTDHDILIEVSANLNSLCDRTHTIDTENKEEHKVIRELIDSNYKLTTNSETRIAEAKTRQLNVCNLRFLPTKIFLWICGFIIVGVIGSYGFTNYVQKDLVAHKVDDAKIMNDFMDHLEKFNKKDVMLNVNVTESISTTDKRK